MFGHTVILASESRGSDAIVTGFNAKRVAMIIADRVKTLRVSKNMSQGDI